MEIKNLDEKDALEFCTRQEDHFFDRKSFEIKPAKIQRIAVAFANADGGEFVIGIADEHDEPNPHTRWKGKASIEDFNGHIQALSEVRPTLPFRFSFFTCVDKPGFVLHVHMDKSNFLHQTSDGTVYVRMSAQVIPINDPQRIMELTYAKGVTSFEDQVVKSARPEDIVDGKPIKDFLTDYSPKTDSLDFIVNQHLVDVITWEPKVAGILLFASSPSAILPRQCAVKIARYETRENEPERDHLKQIFTIEGNLYNQIHDTINCISEVMSSISIWTLDGLKTVSYPPEAIWEIVTNAIIHRDYSISDNIHIHIYNNRIEVLSPGKLPGYVTPQNILDARYSRNPRIVRTLNRYKNPPNKDMGEGLNTAFQKMMEWRLRDPEISEEGNHVKVVIPHASLASPEKAILKFLESNEVIKNSQARDLTGIRSENVMKNVFYKLRDQGLIERVPGLEGPASAWRKIP
ncbi:MAG: ATP-binding protein [Anaerolineales bacterium]|nr:ATP-binding protein [Anaerolineales bacterium]